ncbi:MAG TPA: NAD(P)-dependent oxidoreductase, partial [Bryobacterales bacterium]|nr:NAD(P)-dependent oxidoreductase [Bryobacterales bacterium]
MRTRSAVFVCTLLLASAAAGQNRKIVVTGLGPENMGPEVIGEFQSAAPGLTVVEARSQQDALREIVDADAIFGTINPALLHAAKHLQWVQIYSAGVENYMFPEFINSNITLTNCKIIQGPEISDHAMALLLSLTRRIDEAMPYQVREEWSRGKIHPIELMNKTALIIGLGGIGTQIAQRAHAFGMRVLAVDPKDIPITNVVERIVKPDQLHEVLPEADVVFMSAPLTQQTRGMMGAAEFGMMKKNSYFVAVSRGRTYDSNALV